MNGDGEKRGGWGVKNGEPGGKTWRLRQRQIYGRESDRKKRLVDGDSCLMTGKKKVFAVKIRRQNVFFSSL